MPVNARNLVLLTKPLVSSAGDFERLALASAAEVVTMQDGVYNDPGRLEDIGIGAPPVEKWSALGRDVKARRLETEVRLVEYAGVVEAIARNDKVITI